MILFGTLEEAPAVQIGAKHPDWLRGAAAPTVYVEALRGGDATDGDGVAFSVARRRFEIRGGVHFS